MIITFYSFKGGVGRSMALANIGAWLYRQGRRVLLVDWDLEAPGLESFFLHSPSELNAIFAKPGLIDLIESYRQLWEQSDSIDLDEKVSQDRATSLTEKIGPIRHLFQPLADTPEQAISTRDPGLWLLHAGCRAGASDAFYRRSVHALDWGRFYDEYGGYSFIEWLRRELEKNVDFVLVDSRTGVTEMGGICTQHMADIVILMFAPNDSNLQGAKRIAELLAADKVKALRGSSRPLTVIPIPTRVDTQGATEHLNSFERKFRDEFEGLSNRSLDWCWDSKIRYVTSYSYEESVVVLEAQGHRDLVMAYERIGEDILRSREERLSPNDREYQARYRSSMRQSAPEESASRSQATVQQLINTARAKIDSGDFGTAASLLTSAVDLARQDLGPEHPDTLSAMTNLGQTLSAIGNLSAARDLQAELIDISRRVAGEEHPATLGSMNNLASTLSNQGDIPGARALQEKVLEVRRRVLGEEHPDTLTSMNNLASTLSNQGDLPGARALGEKVLELSRRVLGEEHPDTLSSMDNLASTLWNQGDLPGARALEEKALQARRRVLGEEHPATLSSMNNLARTLGNQGDLPGARALEEKVLQARRRVLGEEHPDTLSSMNNLARTLGNQSDLPGARALEEKVLEARRRVLGDEHPDTLDAALGLGTIARSQGDTDRIRQLMHSFPALAERLNTPTEDRSEPTGPRAS